MSKLQDLKYSLTPRERMILLVIVVVLVFSLLAATVFREQTVTAFRRLTFSQGQDDFPHNAQSNSLFLGLENDLLVSSKTLVQLLSPTGSPHVKQEISMNSPAINAAAPYAVVYDVGGQQLCVLADQELLHQLELPPEESFISATINEDGWVAATTKVSGYKAVVTVYNPAMESVLAIRLSSRYISDAVVTPDCRGVYLISPGQSGGTFENTLLYYTFSTREVPTREISLGSNVVLSILCRDKCWILGDEALLLLDSSGVITASYDYGGQYLKMGTLQGDNFAALFLSRSASGSSGTLVTVDDDGDELGRLVIEGQTIAIAAQSSSAAVLTTSDIFTANRRLEEYSVSPNQRGIRNLAMYDDGSVALIGSATVSLYFPSDDRVKNEPQEEETLPPEKPETPPAEVPTPPSDEGPAETPAETPSETTGTPSDTPTETPTETPSETPPEANAPNQSEEALP